MLKELLGLLNLASPYLLLYTFYPTLALSPFSIVIYSFLIGVYTVFMAYQSSRKLEKSLGYRPQTPYKEAFEAEIRAVGLKETQTSVQYAFNDENIALTIFNTIVIDPTMWRGIENDEQFTKVQQILQSHIIPTIPADKQELLHSIKSILNEPSQRFIFRHELGHVKRNYGVRKLLVIGIQAFLVCITTATIAMSLIEVINGYVLFCASVLFAYLLDVLSTLASNVIFKVPEEYAADLFATKFSTREEIEAAANFFEKYDEVSKNYRLKHTPFWQIYLPDIFSKGYFNGQERARYLRKIAKRKSM